MARQAVTVVRAAARHEPGAAAASPRADTPSAAAAACRARVRRPKEACAGSWQPAAQARARASARRRSAPCRYLRAIVVIPVGRLSTLRTSSQDCWLQCCRAALALRQNRQGGQRDDAAASIQAIVSAARAAEHEPYRALRSRSAEDGRFLHPGARLHRHRPRQGARRRYRVHELGSQGPPSGRVGERTAERSRLQSRQPDFVSRRLRWKTCRRSGEAREETSRA